MPQVQFIATTHDPLCLRGMLENEVQVLRRDEGPHVEQVPDLPNVCKLSVEQLLTSDFFGLFTTEDPRVEEDWARYGALLSKPDRSPAESQELELYRASTQERLHLGSSPANQVIQEALSEYLAQRRTATAPEKRELKREAIQKVLELWKSINVEGIK
jgi:hypothetical protein